MHHRQDPTWDRIQFPTTDPTWLGLIGGTLVVEDCQGSRVSLDLVKKGSDMPRVSWSSLNQVISQLFPTVPFRPTSLLFLDLAVLYFSVNSSNRGSLCYYDWQTKNKWTYMFPRVFGDKFGDEFGDSLNLVINLVTNSVMNFVNHWICWQLWWYIWWWILWINKLGDGLRD